MIQFIDCDSFGDPRRNCFTEDQAIEYVSLTKNKFGHGIECKKIDYSQKDSSWQDYKLIKIALLGEGKIHGAKAVIEELPYETTMMCSVNDSELLIFSKIDFDRIKHESESEGEQEPNPDISAQDLLRTKVTLVVSRTSKLAMNIANTWISKFK